MFDNSSLLRIVKNGYLLVLVALVPLLRPSLPMNTALFDYWNAMAVPVILLLAMMRGKVDVRLVAPVVVIFFGSLLGMLNSPVIRTNSIALAQELYLFLLFIALFNLMRDRRDLDFMVGAWMLVAAAESLLVLSEVAADMSVRARGTFENPNMASSYLGISVFFAFHRIALKRKLVAIPYGFLVCSGMLATKSLSAMGSLGICSVVLFGGYWLRSGSRGRLRVLMIAGVVVLIAVIFLPDVLTLKNYLDRAPGSAAGRQIQWEIGLARFVQNPVMTGVGPNGFAEVGYISGGHWGVGRRLSLHSDYLSFLVERGIVGFAGLAMLLGTVGLFLLRMLQRGERDDMLWLLGMCAMFMFALIDAFSHEVFHYRHVWLILAVIAVEERRLATAGALVAERSADVRTPVSWAGIRE